MYRAPLQELRFVLNTLLPTAQLAALPRHADYSAELADSVLTEAGRFAEAVLDPINMLGDRDGARWTADGVRMPAEFRRAYEQFIAAGARHRGRRDLVQRQSRLHALPAAGARRHRSASAGRVRGAACAIFTAD